MHPIQKLWNEYAHLDASKFRESNLSKIPEMLPGTASFPVSSGTFRITGAWEFSRFPMGGIMFIGNDADLKRNYKKRKKSGFSNGDPEDRMLFWCRVRCLLEIANVTEELLPQGDCFFTNVYPALRHDTKRPRPSPSFRRLCLEFLQKQVCEMTPRLIVAFGTKACDFLGLARQGKSVLRNTTLACPEAMLIERTPVLHLDHPSGRTTALIAKNAKSLIPVLRATRSPKAFN